MDGNKNILRKKLNRPTSAQFERLIDLLETYPLLASSSFQYGKAKSKSVAAWNNIAESLNSIGPPKRTVCQWKKTWSDLKSRTKLNIEEINKSDKYLTEGRGKHLNALEVRVANLCNLAPHHTYIINYLPNSPPMNRVAIVAPSFSPTSHTISKTSPRSSPSPQPSSSAKTVQNTMKKKISKQKRQIYAKELDLLRKQVATQEAMADALESQVQSAEEHELYLHEIAESCKLIATSMSNFIKEL